MAIIKVIRRRILDSKLTSFSLAPTGTVWWSELSRVLPQKDRLAVFNVIAALAGSSDDNSSTQGD